MRRALLIAIALVALYLYSYLLIFAIGRFLAQPPPAWWGTLFATRAHAVLTWLVLCHSAAVLTASLPFAYLIHRTYGRSGPVIALAMTFTLFVFLSIPGLTLHGDSPTRLKIVAVFDQLELIAVLPALVWALNLLPSNQRFERP
jgi:hypothetical protein